MTQGYYCYQLLLHGISDARLCCQSSCQSQLHLGPGNAAGSIAMTFCSKHCLTAKTSGHQHISSAAFTTADRESPLFGHQLSSWPQHPPLSFRMKSSPPLDEPAHNEAYGSPSENHRTLLAATTTEVHFPRSPLENSTPERNGMGKAVMPKNTALQMRLERFGRALQMQISQNKLHQTALDRPSVTVID